MRVTGQIRSRLLVLDTLRRPLDVPLGGPEGLAHLIAFGVDDFVALGKMYSGRKCIKNRATEQANEKKK